jgi:regulator of sirC expression with transglutaminase-like and TPR domain
MDDNGISQFLSNSNEYGVLFYINTFSKGSLFQKDDIDQFLNSIQQTPEPGHFQPCSNSDILRRMLTNLISSFQQVGHAEKVNELIELRTLLD